MTPQQIPALRLPTALLVAALVVGCSGDGEGNSPVDPGTPGESAQEIVSRWLDLDLAAPPNYALPEYPAHYDPRVRGSTNEPSANRVTDRRAALGRVLFYDPQLSVDRSTSCASCHLQSLGFTDPEPRSIGFRGERTPARSMRLGNARFYLGDDAFWDRRSASFEEQALLPIVDSVEMGFTEDVGGLDALVDRMRELEYYPVLFEWAFGSAEIRDTRIAFALAQFVRSLVSVDSEFDRAFESAFRLATPGQPIRELPELSPEAQRGFRVFTRPAREGGAGCSSCHLLPTLALDPTAGNNGLDPGETRIFKAPSLKNVAVTGPYMHDGRFANLDEVVEHYASGVIGSPGLDPRLRGGVAGNLGVPLSQAQKDALVAFMEALTDDDLLVDPKFADPFRR